jgi:rhodanese-related sulfurtransferase
MKKSLSIAALLIFLMVGLFPAIAKSADAPRMTKEELKAMLDSPNLILIDVRAQRDWKGSDLKIKGAVREDPDASESWAKKYAKENIIILYCA